jgi:hypothetical protein
MSFTSTTSDNPPIQHMPSKPILFLIFCGLLPIAASAEQDQVTVLLRENTYAAVQAPLEQYIQDVEARFPVKLHVVKGKWKTPEEVRETIK